MSNVEQLMDQATEHLEQEQFDKAIDCINQALAIEPENAQAWYYKGCAFSATTDYASAISCYETSARFAGDMAALPLYNLGNALQATGRLDEAMNAFGRALQVDPDMGDAWINLGRLIDDAGNHERAVQCYDQALAFAPDDEVAWSNRGNSLRSMKNFEEALASYSKALDLNGSNFAALVGIAACLGHTGNEAQGLELLNQILGQIEDPTVLVEKANILGIMKRYEDALKTIERAIKIGANQPEVWNNHGELLGKLDRFDQSIESFDRALTIEPTFAPAWFGKARTLYNSGRAQEAKEAIAKYYEHSTGTDDLREAANALQSLVSRY